MEKISKEIWRQSGYDWVLLSERIQEIILATMQYKQLPLYLLYKYFGNKILTPKYNFNLKELTRLEVFLGVQFIPRLLIINNTKCGRKKKFQERLISANI